MRLRRTLLAAVSAAALVFPMQRSGSSAYAEEDLCRRILETWEICSACPGYAVGLCLYEGAQCPTRSVCHIRPQSEIGGPIEVDYITSPCYFIQACNPNFGSVCHPNGNPCKKSGPIVELGIMEYPVPSDRPCEPGAP